MALRASARDSDRRVPVESGDGASTFDGNHTDRLVSWLVPFPGMGWSGVDDEQIETLMKWVVGGHLAWCVFPIDMSDA